MKLVAKNSEATLAFREMAANVCRFLAGNNDVDLCESVLQCADALDMDDVPITIIDFSIQPDNPDLAINLVIQGVLKMVASTMVTMDAENPEYQEGANLLAQGIFKLNAVVKTARSTDKAKYR